VTYLAGPISGVPDYLARFGAAELRLRAAGHAVCNPTREQSEVPGRTWEEYLEYDLELLGNCAVIATLDAWWQSRGARVEMAYAAALGIVWMEVES